MPCNAQSSLKSHWWASFEKSNRFYKEASIFWYDKKSLALAKIDLRNSADWSFKTQRSCWGKQEARIWSSNSIKRISTSYILRGIKVVTYNQTYY